MMLSADRRDYQRGYKKHIAAYRYLASDNLTLKSRCLLLFYSVECGLKYKLLKRWNVDSTDGWILDKKDYRAKLMTSHNIKLILKELNQEGTFRFPQIRTLHNENVSVDLFHQFCRYAIESKGGQFEKEIQYEKVLLQIAEWIGEGI